jgi:hypothetical protein
MRLLAPALLLTLLSPAAPAPAVTPDSVACRCSQRTLDHYYASADIVLIGRITSVRRVPESEITGEHFAVGVRPLFRAGRTFKGDLTDVVLTTPTSPAGCGVAVEVGADVVIFASLLPDTGNQQAIFTTCSGSRAYPGPPELQSELFLGLSAREAVARLFELAEGDPGAPPTGEFHTSPACWLAPRIYHQGTLPAAMQARVSVRRVVAPLPAREGIISPNGAYVAYPGPKLIGDSAVIEVDTERLSHLRIVALGVVGPLAPRWVSEKLLFFRAVQGRVQFTDVLVDVELGRPIYIESARDGTLAFEQFQEGCNGQCPCLAVPGSADSLTAPPTPEGLPDEMAALQRLAPDNLAYLDADWDGRVFTEAGGVRFTRSQLHADADAPEHPVMLREVRFEEGAWWLQVAIYEESPCTNSEAEPVHAGWVPAFARSGHLVIATWPGGC